MAQKSFNKPTPYTLRVDDQLLDVTKQKLRLARFPEEQIDVGDDDWSQGAKVKVVKRLAEYWADGFDWRAVEVVVPLSKDLRHICQFCCRPGSMPTSTNSP